MISLATAFLALAPLELGDPWLTFSRSPAFDPRVTTIEVGTLAREGDEWNYWFRRTVRRGRAVGVWFADTRRCPAARWVVYEASKVAPPRINVPGDPSLGDEFIVTADGVWYAVEAGARYGNDIGSEIRFGSNVGTPLADWVDESLRRLEPCWSKTAPAAP